MAADSGEAKTIFLENILPGLVVKSASWADSMTLHESGILDEIKNNPDISVIETFAEGVPREEAVGEEKTGPAGGPLLYRHQCTDRERSACKPRHGRQQGRGHSFRAP